jgi:hypothetical protein
MPNEVEASLYKNGSIRFFTLIHIVRIGRNTMKKLILIAVIIVFSGSLSAGEEKKEIDDYNFDGYKDYRVLIMPNGKMTLWDYFLFVPKEKKYKNYPALTDLWNPKFDKKNKRIITFAPGGHSGVIFVSSTYYWKDGNIQLIETTVQDWDYERNLYVYKVSKHTDGKIKVDTTLFLNFEEAQQKMQSIKYFE